MTMEWRECEVQQKECMESAEYAEFVALYHELFVKHGVN